VWNIGVVCLGPLINARPQVVVFYKFEQHRTPCLRYLRQLFGMRHYGVGQYQQDIKREYLLTGDDPGLGQ
jgi:hypothetical protein